MSRKKNKVAIVALVLLAIVIGCVVGSSEADTKGVSGTVNIAGSSASAFSAERGQDFHGQEPGQCHQH